MEMTEGAIKAIQQPAIDAEGLKNAAKFVPTPDPRKHLLVHGAKHEEFEVPPPFRAHQVASLVDMFAYASHAEKGVLWHSLLEVVLILDDTDRRDRVTLPLTMSEGWKRLRSLERPEVQSLTQKDLIKLLRCYLAASPATVAIFRKLEFNTQIKGAGDFQKSRESLGKQIEAEVQGTVGLPDDLLVEVPIYDTVGERQTYTVQLLLDYDAQNQRILVMPEPGAIAEAEDSHQADIHQRLTAGVGGNDGSAGIPVYHGSP